MTFSCFHSCWHLHMHCVRRLGKNICQVFEKKKKALQLPFWAVSLYHWTARHSSWHLLTEICKIWLLELQCVSDHWISSIGELVKAREHIVSASRRSFLYHASRVFVLSKSCMTVSDFLFRLPSLTHMWATFGPSAAIRNLTVYPPDVVWSIDENFLVVCKQIDRDIGAGMWISDCLKKGWVIKFLMHAHYQCKQCNE